jgi:GNAT superfamily N-acetyltransferase
VFLPEFRAKGFGTLQIKEILRRFKDAGYERAFVRTGEHPFFIPAQKMYLACGFKECERHPTGDQPNFGTIDYEMYL